MKCASLLVECTDLDIVPLRFHRIKERRVAKARGCATLAKKNSQKEKKEIINETVCWRKLVDDWLHIRGWGLAMVVCACGVLIRASSVLLVAYRDRWPSSNYEVDAAPR